MNSTLSPQGPGLYLRRINRRRHGTPKQFAKLCADHRLGWIAIAAIWQDAHRGRVRTRRMNGLDTVHAYADALEARGIPVWVWGYPWQGAEEHFRDVMIEYATTKRVLLDPELGANPERASGGAGKRRANAHAALLVQLFAETFRLGRLDLSTFGTGWRIRWFPLLAFTKALVKHFGGRSFIGGQTYTDDDMIDLSIADMRKVIDRAGGTPIVRSDPDDGTGIEVVPNFGVYAWDTPSGRRTKGAKARPKTVHELRSHLHEFVDDDEPIDAVIGWAENFMNRALWNELARFADLMERGACSL